MINEFAKTKFFLSVAHKQIYEPGFNFNESNIVQYLAELEEYIAILITYLATKRDDPSAPFALVPLDKLDTKNHHKKEIAVRTTKHQPLTLTLDRGTCWLCSEPRQCSTRRYHKHRRSRHRDHQLKAALSDLHEIGGRQHNQFHYLGSW